MESPTAFMTVAEAARALSLHPNSVRKRIAKGQYSVEWTDSAHGKIQLIPRGQILDGVVPPTDVSAGFIARPQPPDIPQMLGVFVSRLEETASENGRLKAELAAALAQVAALRSQLALPAGAAQTRRSWTERTLGFLGLSNGRG